MPRLRATLGIAGLLALLLIAAWPLRAVSQEADAAAAWRQMFKRPSTPPPSPADNPLTADKIALGARLFSDVRLSGGGDRSCASCHDPDRAFTDGRRRALALSGAPLRRNTPSLWNLAWSKQFFWDGRAPSLETQVRMPIEEPQELGGDWPAIVRRLEVTTSSPVSSNRPFRGTPAFRRIGSPRRLPHICDRWSRRRRGSTRGSTATRRRYAPPRCAASGCSSARPVACCATWAGASPTIASTTSA